MKKNSLKNLVRNPIFWVVTAAFVLALLIIFAGGYLFESFEQLTLRLLVGFSIFFGTLLIILVYMLYFKEETQKRLQERKALKAKNREVTDVVDGKIKDLKARFVEATKIIKNSSIYRDKHNADYELPWYLMVGSEGAGKTALLESSGLEFPLNINYANRTAKEEGTTQSFQWYFAEHAIFVDMPGRYIEQREDSVDADLWQAFLRLFRKQRWKRPINGVVLTVSVDTLFEKSEQELEHFAKQLRIRFDELSETFMSTIPIYLFVTKSDRVPGFDEYFASISDEEKNEVLGMTFDDADNVDSAKVQPELDALIERLNASVLDRMHKEWDNDARSKILLFCDEFAALFEKLKLFIDIGFAQTRYRAPLLLRGIYFTSVPRQSLPDFSAENGTLPASAEAKGLFIRKVLRDVMFPEADIVKMDTTYRQKQKNRQIGIFVAAAVLVAFVTLLWIRDFSLHADRVERLDDMLKEYSRDLTQIKSGEDFEKSLYVLNEIRDTLNYDDVNSSTRFWKLAFFKTEERQEKLQELYHASLEKMLLPYVGSLLQAQVKANIEDYDLTWESTKAYLMLKDEAHRDPQFLERWLATAWSHLYPNKLPIQDDLNAHWGTLLAKGFQPLELDGITVDTARQKLLGLGQEALVYKQLREQPQVMGLKGFQFAGVMGSNAAAFHGNDYMVPGFFTKTGYEAVMVARGKDMIRDIIRTNWIVGYDTNLTEAELNSMYAKVQSFYFNDYKKEWMNALNTLQIPRETSISQISNQLTVLTAADSPIVAILKALRDHTQLYTPSEKLQMAATEEGSRLATMGQSATGKVAENASRMLEDTSVKNIREFFKEYHQLLSREGGSSAVLQASMEQMERAYLETTAMNGSVSPRKDAFHIVMDRINGKHLPIATRATSLPIPVNKWFEKALQNDWEYIIAQSKNYISDQYRSQVYAYYKEKFEGKYPFNPTSTRDVSLLDFEEFFKKGGVLDQFYSQYVAPFVNLNQSRRVYEYRNIDGSSMYFDRGFVRSMFIANDIRKRFLMNRGETPSTTFYLKPSDLGRNLAGMALHYDNNYFGYEHGPIKTRKISWPAETDNPAARFQLFDLNNERVVSFADDGEWALFRLLGRLKPKQYRESNMETVTLEYRKDDFRAAFTVSGPPAKIFSKTDPFKAYRLDGGI